MNLTDPQFIKRDDLNGYLVTHACACGHVTKGEIEAVDLFRWRQGASVQAAFPNLSLTQREALFVSGICGFCWDAMFEGDDDEPDTDEFYRPGSGDDDYDEATEQDYEDTYTSGEQYMADMYNSDSYIAYLNG